jgi:hypothetical protein
VLAVGSLFLAVSDVRQTIFTLFFVLLAVACVLQQIVIRWPHSRAWCGWLLIFALAESIILGAKPYLRPDMLPLQRAGEHLAANFSHTRVAEVVHSNSRGLVVPIGPDASAVHLSRVQMLRGAHQFDATPALNPMVSVLRTLNNDIQQGRVRDDTYNLLQMYNVGVIIGYRGNAMGVPVMLANAQTPPLGQYRLLPYATPILASGRLQRVPMPQILRDPPLWIDYFDKNTPSAANALQQVEHFYNAMQVNIVQRTAAQFLVPQLPTDTVVGMPPHITLHSYNVTPSTVHINFTANKAGFVRLAHPITPAHVVRLNNTIVQPLSDVFAMPVLAMPQGDSQIDITVQPTNMRLYCGLITLIVVLQLLWAMAPIKYLRIR